MLVDSRAVVEDIWLRWATARGLDPAPILRVAHGRRAQEVLRALDTPLNIEREVQWLDAAAAADDTPLTAIPGARELLTELPPDRWGIVTSGDRALASGRLDRAKLPYPAVFVTGEVVAHGKPDPEGYFLGAKLLQRDPASCVVFEDAPAGVAAARAAGAQVIGLTTTHRADDLRAAVAILPDLTSVKVSRSGALLTVNFEG